MPFFWGLVLAAHAAAIPQIDVSALVTAGSDRAAAKRVADEIAAACRDRGFFTMVGHGIDQSVFEGISRRAHEFFDLPEAVKDKLAPQQWNPDATAQYRGYFPKSANGKEGFDIGNLLPEAAAAYDSGKFKRHGALDEPPVLPPRDAVPPGWFGDVEQYYRHMMRLGRLVLRAVSMHWDYPDDHLESMLIPEDGSPTLSTLRFNKYPASTIEEALSSYKLRADENASQPLSCDTHTDGCVLTFLYQSDVGGLQAEAIGDDGKRSWIDVPVVPNALVVNTGVAMQRIVNGVWNATNHRVLWSGQARLSLPFFFEPGYESTFGPLDATVRATPGREARYSPTTYGPYLVENNKRHKEYARKDMKGSSFVPHTLDFIHKTRYEDLPPAVVAEVKRALLDVLGVAIGAQLTGVPAVARMIAKSQYAGQDASLWLHGGKVSVAGAALANGLSVDALDMHDSAHNAKGHAGAALVPALLALLEGAGGSVSGKEMLATLAVGYEVAYRAGECLVGSSSDYHSSGAWNALGVAAMAARLLQLTHDETLHALGIAEYHGPVSSVMRVMNNPTMLKDGSGWGAMAGVTAAYMASFGLTGAPADLVQNKRAELWASLGSDWHILRFHVYKRHGTCYWAQAAVNGAVTLRERIWPESRSADSDGKRGFTPPAVEAAELARVVSVEILTFVEALHLFQGVPKSTEEAQYGLRYATAAALMHGVVGPQQLTGDALRDPVLQSLIQKTNATLHPKFAKNELHQTKVHDNSAEVRVVLDNGTMLTSGQMYVEWDNFRGMPAPTDGELRAKFRWLAAAAGVSAADASVVESLAMAAEDVEDASELALAMASTLSTCAAA